MGWSSDGLGKLHLSLALPQHRQHTFDLEESMSRTLGANPLAVLCALTLFATPAVALPEGQAVFTDFEHVSPNTSSGETITVGVSPDSAELGGDAFGGRIGVLSLYHSGVRSWMVV